MLLSDCSNAQAYLGFHYLKNVYLPQNTFAIEMALLNHYHYLGKFSRRYSDYILLSQ